MGKKYYQVILNNGKTHPSLYVNLQTAIKKVGVANIKEIKEIRSELVDSNYNVMTGTLNID
jgi:hypothetical protein